jgi:hypothetical protein
VRLEEKIRFDPPPREAIAVVRLARIIHESRRADAPECRKREV